MNDFRENFLFNYLINKNINLQSDHFCGMDLMRLFRINLIQSLEINMKKFLNCSKYYEYYFHSSGEIM